MKRLTLVSILVAELFAIYVGIHDALRGEEDSRIVWVCQVHGNKQCGPNESLIDVEWGFVWRW